MLVRGANPVNDLFGHLTAVAVIAACIESELWPQLGASRIQVVVQGQDSTLAAGALYKGVVQYK
jgi:hypothetical protein